MKLRTLLFLLVPALMLTGCANYRWTSTVPDELRTIAVPVFQNSTAAAELGPIVTRKVLNEFQREATFSLRRSGESSIEVQGEIAKATLRPLTYDRSYSMRAKEYRYIVTAKVSLINKDKGEVIWQNRAYSAETTFLTQGDMLTGQRNAAERIGAELARQIVDDAVSFDYTKSAKKDK